MSVYPKYSDENESDGKEEKTAREALAKLFTLHANATMTSASNDSSASC